MPIRIQRKRSRGWKMPTNTVYVGRPTKWGNPYRADLFGGPERTTELFRRYINHDNEGAKQLQADARELRGKNLACWCPLDQPCHADVLLEWANTTVVGHVHSVS